MRGHLCSSDNWVRSIVALHSVHPGITPGIDVLSFGSIGDSIWALPVIRELSKKGNRITLHVMGSMAPIFKFNPYVHTIVVYPDTFVGDQTKQVMIEKTEGYDYLDLSAVLAHVIFRDHEFYGCRQHSDCYEIGCSKCESAHNQRVSDFSSKNMIEMMLQEAGLPEADCSTSGEIRFSVEEIEAARDIVEEWSGRFVVLWALSPLGYKQYPFLYEVSQMFLDRHPNVLVYTMGGKDCDRYEKPQEFVRHGHWHLRKSFLMSSLSSIVIGGETGMMCAASCFPKVRKVVMLGQYAAKNLTSTWENTEAINPNVPCFPCYQAHWTLDSCPLTPVFNGINWPICKAAISKERILQSLEETYQQQHQSMEKKQWVSTLV